MRELPERIPNLIIAYAGATAEQAVLDVLRNPDLAQGASRLPDGNMDLVTVGS